MGELSRMTTSTLVKFLSFFQPYHTSSGLWAYLMGCGQHFALVGKDMEESAWGAYVFLKHMLRFPLNEGDWCHYNDTVFLDFCSSIYNSFCIILWPNLSFYFIILLRIYFCVFLFLSLFSVSKQLGYFNAIEAFRLCNSKLFIVLGNVIDIHSVSFHQMHIVVHLKFLSWIWRRCSLKWSMQWQPKTA